ncbi:hypothetical protein [Legionella quateirensis]|uniref:Dot/Icm T4SS effector n=1 Tax=Legionella quateirensis TaxID=45072 RepID=A0A378KPD5_9GAMM|nr:hypothetical protein [Legionella quateirensis]KTD52845.1 Dot/Icm T4SS effector [Legionella quateirensis]STY16425.1 Dot/Icm T4SS effector [Legionella quateirensis]
MRSNVLYNIVKQVTSEIHQEISACNIPGEKERNRFFSTLVYMSQCASDKILANTKFSFLERILLCAKEITQSGAGNCQLQSFVALDRLIRQFVTASLTTYDLCIPISIYTTANHAFILVNGTLVCDPWNNFVGSIKDSTINLSNRTEYFGIRSNWDCFDSGKYDRYSTEYTCVLMKQIEIDSEKNSEKACVLKDYSGTCETLEYNNSCYQK